MKTGPVRADDLRGVFAVPPLARREDADRALDFAANQQIVRHLLTGGITRLLYGGNAFLYHLRLTEYAGLIEWLASLEGDVWAIPSAGPSYGRAMDQAPLLRRYPFPAVMMLPCADPRTPRGLEQGLREFADASEKRLILYLKEEGNFGIPKEEGLDVIASLVKDGICVAIKYAVVRRECDGAPPPADDRYLQALLSCVDRSLVVSGIGERPAVAHMCYFALPGFTTGSGCVAPARSQALFHACAEGRWERAERIREAFLPLEDIRDRLGPSVVLHHAVAAAGIASSGPVPPFMSGLPPLDLEALTVVVEALRAQDAP